ncbi:MAG: hypothetical protein ACI9BF_000020 [Candidatus Paceibacteria bacterium]|jgi:hypothetical protein
MDIFTLLIIGHLVGTVLGVGGATMIEFHLNKALSDGNMSLDERSMLGLNFVVLRIGLVLALVTGFGFLVYYVTHGQAFRLQNPVLWAKLFMVVIVGVNALLLQSHKIGLYWGSALSFVTWWATMILGIFLTNNVRFDFITIMIGYLLAVVAGAFILHKIRDYVKLRYKAKNA